MQPAIEIHNIEKSFDLVKAVKSFSLNIGRGELFGLIGPDGAGKTTLFRMLASLLIPDKGWALLEGFHTVNEYKEIRKIIGYMPGSFSLYQDISVERNLHFFATIFGTSVQENYYLIEDIYTQLEPFKKRKAGKLSGGMKQKLALCCALIHEPKVLLLDEPTTGVDAVSRAEFWEMLKQLKNKGITIVVSTPYMDEAIRCERIALMQDGNILRIGGSKEITQDYNKPLFAVKAGDFYKLLIELRSQSFTQRVEPFGEYLHLTTTTHATEKEIRHFLDKKGYTEIEVKPIEPTVEDIFLDLIKKPKQ